MTCPVSPHCPYQPDSCPFGCQADIELIEVEESEKVMSKDENMIKVVAEHRRCIDEFERAEDAVEAAYKDVVKAAGVCQACFNSHYPHCFGNRIGKD